MSRSSARPIAGSESLAKSATSTGQFTSALAQELAEDVLERLLRYARIDTQAEYRAGQRPSTEKQLDLSRLLVDELRELGLEDARLTEDANVFARLPGDPALRSSGSSPTWTRPLTSPARACRRSCTGLGRIADRALRGLPPGARPRVACPSSPRGSGTTS